MNNQNKNKGIVLIGFSEKSLDERLEEKREKIRTMNKMLKQRLKIVKSKPGIRPSTSISENFYEKR